MSLINFLSGDAKAKADAMEALGLPEEAIVAALKKIDPDAISSAKALEKEAQAVDHAAAFISAHGALIESALSAVMAINSAITAYNEAHGASITLIEAPKIGSKSRASRTSVERLHFDRFAEWLNTKVNASEIDSLATGIAGKEITFRLKAGQDGAMFFHPSAERWMPIQTLPSEYGKLCASAKVAKGNPYVSIRVPKASKLSGSAKVLDDLFTMASADLESAD